MYLIDNTTSLEKPADLICVNHKFRLHLIAIVFVLATFIILVLLLKL